MKKLIRGLGLVSVAVASLLSVTFFSNTVAPNVAFATTGGGPIVLDGMDPVCHASYGERTDVYVAKVLKSVYDKSTMPSNNGKIAILGVSSPTSAAGCGGNWATLLSTKFYSEFSSAPTADFISSSADLNTFFSTTIISTPPRMIWIPDDWSRSAAINNIFTANAEKIADFVNSGGGLFTSNNGYGWLTSLLPSAVFNSGGCNGGPEATADGTADFGLTNATVAACWHGYFTGSFGTLKTLVDYPYPSPTSSRKSVSIGGGAVSLPSSFTLGVSPASPNAGDDITITALAQTLAGVPQAGVSVMVMVSTGPDAGQMFTATTNASGVATITIRTSSVGTNVYTATAVVNGVSKSVSATVVWAPAPTTTTIATTTTVPATTTTVAPTTTVPVTTVAPTTTVSHTTVPATTVIPSTTVAVVVPETSTTIPLTTTTVHVHSHVSNLPKTGSSFGKLLIIAIISLFCGFLFMWFTSEEKMRK